MISHKIRKGRMPKMSKNLERLYKEGKCSECTVVVTRMDFAKILGKFTKVKIQYESNSTSKTKKNTPAITSPNSRLKSNENGMVLIHRKAYNQHPVKETLNLRNTKANQSTPRNKNELKENSSTGGLSTPRQANNVLRENNRIKKDAKGGNQYFKNVLDSNLKTYGIVFVNPVIKNNNEKNEISLTELLPLIEKSILPTDDWCIDYLPKKGEPKEDKVYDRIAAELEDLMNNEKSAKAEVKSEVSENKDDFPSIMDILNDNTSTNSQTNNQSSVEFKSSIESSDVEAILLGKTSAPNKAENVTPMEVDNNNLSTLMDVEQINTSQESGITEPMGNPHSPSILDEALQKGIEEHLPALQVQEDISESSQSEGTTTTSGDQSNVEKENNTDKENKTAEVNYSTVTHVVFKKTVNGLCQKAVTCPKNLKYSVELNGKSVEFLGAPKFITSVEDLKILLEIVNDSQLDSLYVFH